jgi:hypothetical protein
MQRLAILAFGSKYNRTTQTLSLDEGYEVKLPPLKPRPA